MNLECKMLVVSHISSSHFKGINNTYDTNETKERGIDHMAEKIVGFVRSNRPR